MASVYKGFDPSLERFVAIKVLASELSDSEEFRSRFLREMKALARLDHQNIAQIHDFGEDKGHCYMVLQFFARGDLRSLLGRPMAPPEALKFFRGIAAGLAAAHELQIVHRDLKPANILIGDDARPVLGDFGIAKILAESNITGGSSVGLGTPDYMAPEQLDGKADARSDVYAFGIVAYEILTGLRPFRGDTPLAVAMKHLHEPFPRPIIANSPFAAPFEGLILKCTARDPKDRYQDGRALSEAIEKISIAGGEEASVAVPSVASGTSAPESATSWPEAPIASTPARRVEADATSRESVIAPKRAASRPMRKAVLSGLGLLLMASVIYIAFSTRTGGRVVVQPPGDDTTEVVVPIDTLPPYPTRLEAFAETEDSVELRWRSPADQPDSGAVAGFDLRWTDQRDLRWEWDRLIRINYEVPPGPPGEMHRLTISGLRPDMECWFRIKSSDSAGNVSDAPDPVFVRTPPRPPETGTVVISVTPEDAAIALGERKRSGPRATFDDVAPGKHWLTVSAEGYVTERDEITILAGRTTDRSFTLAEKPEPPKPPRPGYGSIRVPATKPPYEIVLDEIPQGKWTPNILDSVAAGPHRISLRRANGSYFTKRPISVTVEPGQRTEVPLDDKR